MNGKRKEFRCKKCNKLLFKFDAENQLNISIICPRCSSRYNVRAKGGILNE